MTDLLAMEVGIESGRLRTGRLQPEEWPLLGQGISTLGQMPIFIDDKPNAGVLEMRSLCRRLMAESGKHRRPVRYRPATNGFPRPLCAPSPVPGCHPYLH